MPGRGLLGEEQVSRQREHACEEKSVGQGRHPSRAGWWGEQQRLLGCREVWEQPRQLGREAGLLEAAISWTALSPAAAQDQAKEECRAPAEPAVSVRQQAAVRAGFSASSPETRCPRGWSGFSWNIGGPTLCFRLNAFVFLFHFGLSVSTCLIFPQKSLFCNSSLMFSTVSLYHTTCLS